MDVITIESGLWQELTDRIKKIERYGRNPQIPSLTRIVTSGLITARLSACSVSAEGHYSNTVLMGNWITNDSADRCGIGYPTLKHLLVSP